MTSAYKEWASRHHLTLEDLRRRQQELGLTDGQIAEAELKVATERKDFSDLVGKTIKSIGSEFSYSCGVERRDKGETGVYVSVGLSLRIDSITFTDGTLWKLYGDECGVTGDLSE